MKAMYMATLFCSYPSCAPYATITTFLSLAMVESIPEGYRLLMTHPH